MPKQSKVSAKPVALPVVQSRKVTQQQPITYRLQFLPSAKAEWDKLDGSLQLQFTKALSKRILAPRVPKAALAGMPDCYKIKLRGVGYRLVYRVIEAQLVLLTIAVGKRDQNLVYTAAQSRMNQS